jgi:hypothetical protein
MTDKQQNAGESSTPDKGDAKTEATGPASELPSSSKQQIVTNETTPIAPKIVRVDPTIMKEIIQFCKEHEEAIDLLLYMMIFDELKKHGCRCIWLRRGRGDREVLVLKESPLKTIITSAVEHTVEFLMKSRANDNEKILYVCEPFKAVWIKNKQDGGDEMVIKHHFSWSANEVTA